jgi:hypothetical protein
VGLDRLGGDPQLVRNLLVRVPARDDSEILGSIQSGTTLADRYVRGSGSQLFVLDLQAGIGEIMVETED